MNKLVNRLVTGALILSALSYLAAAAPHSDSRQYPDLDRRPPIQEATALGSPIVQTAIRALSDRTPGLVIDLDSDWQVPEHVFSTEQFLSEPRDEAQAQELLKSDTQLQESPAAQAIATTERFLNDNPEIFGLGGGALAGAKLVRDHLTPHTGMRTLVWMQELEGIPIFERLLVSHVTAEGALVSLSTRFLPNVAGASRLDQVSRTRLTLEPPVTGADAVMAAAASLGIPLDQGELRLINDPALPPDSPQQFAQSGQIGEASASLIWLPLRRDDLRLCWQVHLLHSPTSESYQIIIDAEDPDEAKEPWIRRSLVAHISNATYRVFSSDSPKPMSPGYSSPTSTEPVQVPTTDITLQALSVQASPNGWIDDGETRTIGNNVDAHTDLNEQNIDYNAATPPGDLRAQSLTRTFTYYSINLASDPSTYRAGSVVNAFYWCNWMHDRLYGLGFTETAGNFQQNNFGRGGVGGDAMIVEVQNNAANGDKNGGNLIWGPLNNAADGSRARMQLYIWDGPNPDRDGALDAEVILHEYAHGLTWRVVGKGVVFTANQTKGLAEGWSDFYALALLSQASDNPAGNYANSAYSVREWSYSGQVLLQNYYFGIRRYPCSQRCPISGDTRSR